MSVFNGRLPAFISAQVPEMVNISKKASTFEHQLERLPIMGSIGQTRNKYRQYCPTRQRSGPMGLGKLIQRAKAQLSLTKPFSLMFCDERDST